MNKLLLFGLSFLFIYSNSFALLKDTLNVNFQSEGYKLRGEIIAPNDRSAKMPAIIFLVGSGGNSSPSKNYKKFIEFFLEQSLERENVALMYFDKRGVGQSEGVWYKTDFLQRAIDAKNAAEYLKTLPFINPDKIFVVGHSQGGWIVQLCLAQYPNIFAGGISMAGATFGVRKQLVNDYQSKLACSKQLSSEKAHAKAKRKANKTFAFVSIFPLKQNWKQLRRIRNFEIEPYLVNITLPILYMWGENDELVYPQWCLDDLTKKFPNGLPHNFEIYIGPSENHSFKKTDFCYKGLTNNISYSHDSREKLIQWLKKEFSKKP